ncbi:hypothetical protein EUGRSUZ_E04069 [Eucalyptus grandis]|uniref:Uncharacterized protein n=2 Tax=Eucalyptus grandis TaxID=71139 RepID=A0ACC3L0N2_EUCGR|nr:hypothetical protein EUGRSUZ_E04069 [Eucalyptus grandis]
MGTTINLRILAVSILGTCVNKVRKSPYSSVKNCKIYSRGHDHQKLKCHITIHNSAISTEKIKTPLKRVGNC